MDAPQPSPENPTLPRSPWSGRDLGMALGMLLLGYAVVVVIVTMVVIYIGDPAEDSAAALANAVATLGFTMWLGTVVLILATRRGLTLAEIGFRRLRGAAIAWPFATWAGGIGIVLLYTMLIAALDEFVGRDLSRLAEGNPLPDTDAMTNTVWFVIGISVVLAAPIGEELFFRGLIFRAIQARWGLLAGMVVSGLLFSLVHFEVSVVIPFWGIGMLFAFAYHQTGSLWTPVLAHAIFNGVSFIATIGGMAS